MVLLHGLDEVARVKPLGTMHKRSYNVRAKAFAVAYDSVLCLLGKVVDKEHAKIYRAQLLKQRIDNLKQVLALACVGDDGVNHLVVAVHHSLKLFLPCFVALKCKLRSGKELVGDATKGTDNNNDRLFLGLFLYNSLQAENTLYGTY